MDQQLNYEILQLIRDDLKEGPFLRIYSQQQTFSISKQPNNSVQLPFNQIFNQTVNELNIMNRHIASNTRLTNSFLQNGREIFLKKQSYFNNFLKIYPMIANVLESLPHEQKFIQIYSMMTISNLILKLSINMAKISIISVNKFPTHSCFNIFIVSIIFEKFLQFNLLLSKQKIASKQNNRLNLAKQFPKLSIIKLSKIKNNYDSKYIQKCQQLFHDKVSNIQFIELYEQNPFKDNKRAYSRHQSINLKQELGITAPFGFELYLFISNIIISKMNDFRPDIIIYMEDYSNDCVVIQPKVKGLIINEFSAKVQNKIFIFKQFGMTSQMKNEKMIQMNMPILEEAYDKKELSILININAITDAIQTSDQIQEQSILQQKIKTLSIQNTLIHRDINNYLTDQNKKIYKQIQKNMITQQQIKIDNPFIIKVQQMKKILLDQLTYLSLAMIQKSGFQEVIDNFRNNTFSSCFLDKLIQWIESQNQYYTQIDKGYSETCQLLKKTKQKIRGMLNLTNYVPRQLYCLPPQVYGFPIFNLRTNKMENCIQFKDKKLKSITVQQQDQFYIAYQPEYIIIFVFKQSKYIVYTRHDSQMYFTAQIDEIYNSNTMFLSQKNSILIANQKYFYKAFGQYKNDSLNIQGAIYRICIQKPTQIRGCDWKSLGNTCLVYSKPNGKSKTPFSNGVKVPLQLKRHGYGYSYNTIDVETKKQVNIVIFGGGYNYKIQNEQKINRFFYIIKDHDEKITKIGKTNGDLINQTQNLRNKAIVYPFVYGIPLEYEKGKQFAVLNTNGLLSNVNHFKKLFLSRVKIGSLSSPFDIGIIAQNKLDYNKDTSQVSIANKNTIISHLLSNYNKINRLDGRIVLYRQNNQIMVFKLEKNKQLNFDTFTIENSSTDNNAIQVKFGNGKLVSMIPDFKGMKTKQDKQQQNFLTF